MKPEILLTKIYKIFRENTIEYEKGKFAIKLSGHAELYKLCKEATK